MFRRPFIFVSLVFSCTLLLAGTMTPASAADTLISCEANEAVPAPKLGLVINKYMEQRCGWLFSLVSVPEETQSRYRLSIWLDMALAFARTSGRLPLRRERHDRDKKRPIYPIHPGTILGDELAELEMSPAKLARELHVPSNRLYQLIAGKRAMTADTALRLQQWLGVD